MSLNLSCSLGLLIVMEIFLPNLSNVLFSLSDCCRKTQSGLGEKNRKQHSKKWRHYSPQTVFLSITIRIKKISFGLRFLTIWYHCCSFISGAVLSYRSEYGQEKPIASQFLGIAKKKYSQLEKEILAIIFAVKQFHQYLLGHQFSLYQITSLFNTFFLESRSTLTLASTWKNHWALILGGSIV